MRTVKFIQYMFSLVGLGMLLGAVYWIHSTRVFIDQAEIAQGEVIDLIASYSDGSTTYKPKVLFVDGRGKSITFITSFSSNPPAYSRGEQVEVLYLPAEPAKAKINGFFSLWGGASIIAIMGCVFLGVGGGMVFYGVRKAKREAWLKLNGRPLITEFQCVERNTRLKVNGRSPWRIVSQWQDPRSRKLHTFRSDNIWFNPEDYIQDKQITVLTDRDNPKRYYMDISFLPEQATGCS